MAIDEKLKQRYLSDPNICPFCKSPHISAGHIEADGEYAWGSVHCNNCGKNWTDNYTLTGIEPDDEE